MDGELRELARFSLTLKGTLPVVWALAPEKPRGNPPERWGVLGDLQLACNWIIIKTGENSELRTLATILAIASLALSRSQPTPRTDTNGE